jgi:hypothetical protein
VYSPVINSRNSARISFNGRGMIRSPCRVCDWK